MNGNYSPTAPSNLRLQPQPYPRFHAAMHPERPRDQVIQAETVITERKEFKLTLRENAGGKFIRVDETRGHMHNAIIISAEAVGEFQVALASLANAMK